MDNLKEKEHALRCSSNEAKLHETKRQTAGKNELIYSFEENWQNFGSTLARKITSQADLVDLGIFCNAPPFVNRNESVHEIHKATEHLIHDLPGNIFRKLTTIKNAFDNMNKTEDFKEAMLQCGLNPNSYFDPSSTLHQDKQSTEVDVEKSQKLDNCWGTLLEKLASTVQTREMFHDLGKYFNIPPIDIAEILDEYYKDLTAATWRLLCVIVKDVIKGTRISKLQMLHKAFQYADAENHFKKTLQNCDIDLYSFIEKEQEEKTVIERKLEGCWTDILETFTEHLCPDHSLDRMSNDQGMPYRLIHIIRRNHPCDCLTAGQLIMKQLVRDWLPGNKTEKLQQLARLFAIEGKPGIFNIVMSEHDLHRDFQATRQPRY